jgi:hypothetical protein
MCRRRAVGGARGQRGRQAGRQAGKGGEPARARVTGEGHGRERAEEGREAGGGAQVSAPWGRAVASWPAELARWEAPRRGAGFGVVESSRGSGRARRKGHQLAGALGASRQAEGGLVDRCRYVWLVGPPVPCMHIYIYIYVYVRTATHMRTPMDIRTWPTGAIRIYIYLSVCV